MSNDQYQQKQFFEESGPFPDFKDFERKRKEFNNSEFKVVPIPSKEQLIKTFSSTNKNHGKNI